MKLSFGTLWVPTTYAYNEPSGLLKTVTYPHPFEGGGTLNSSLTYDSYGNPLTFTEPGENVFASDPSKTARYYLDKIVPIYPTIR